MACSVATLLQARNVTCRKVLSTRKTAALYWATLDECINSMGSDDLIDACFAANGRVYFAVKNCTCVITFSAGAAGSAVV